MKRIPVIIFSGVLLICATVLVSAQDKPSTNKTPKIGKGVIEEIQAGRGANVVIALVPPAATKSMKPDLPGLRKEIGTMQQAVLSNLSISEYRSRRTFRAIPALSGKVLTESALAKLAAHPHVVRIDLDVGGSGGLANSVPVIGADLRHAGGNTGEGVVVAVLDSGLDSDHDNLADDLIHEECFLDNDGSIDGFGLCPNGSDRQSGPGAAEDDAGHGTHVTGIVTSSGAQGSAGAAPDADIVALKITAGPSFGGVFYYFSEVVAALDFVINNPQYGVRVINMSIGTFAQFEGDCDNSTAYNMAGAAAINTLRANGVTAFASAGNNGSGTQMGSPACLSNVVSVGATNNADNVAAFSNSNSSTDIFAPGVSVLSSSLFNSTVFASGTSMASPHAAACAALLIESGETLTPDAIETRLEISPVQVTDPTNNLTFPRIDCSPSLLAKRIVSGPDRSYPTPTSLTFETLNTTCESFDNLGFYLNGVFLGGQVADPSGSCACLAPLQTFVVDDAALIASLWNEGGFNDFRVTKSSSGFGNAIAWARVNFGAGSTCIFDIDGGGCSELDLCAAGFTFGAVDRTGALDPSDGVIDRVVEVGLPESSTYDFEVVYLNSGGVPVLIRDTVPAEWGIELVDDDDDRASAESAAQDPDAPSATKIRWEPVPQGGSIRARAETRVKPNGSFSPSSCGTLILNNGAAAYELDPATGMPVTDASGNELPPFLESERLCVAAVEDVDGDGAVATDGTGDEDGDGLTDYTESCDLGTSPCVADTDGDGFDDGVEVSRGSDPLSPDSAPANVRLDNATTPRGDVFVGDEGFVGRLLSELGNTLSAPIAWVGRGGVPGSEFGCDTTPADLVLTDLAVPYGEKVRGKIALIERGTCFFTTKVALAESRGAVGVIIYNNAGDGVISMGVPAGWSVPIGIPAIFIGQSDGEAIAILREANDSRRLLATLTGLTP